MSRSNPTSELVHPCQRWFEWSSSDKCFYWYDKAKKEQVAVPLPFTFIVLDRTATIRGYNKKQKSGIFANEVRDTRSQPFVAKFFHGGPFAQGLWQDIKDTITARSGKFAVNLYIGFKPDKTKPDLKLGAVQLTGCALGAWFEFDKANKAEILAKAVTVKTFRNDTSGDVEFNAPVFSLVDITPEADSAAKEIDKALQTYLDGYFKRPTAERTDEHGSRATGGSDAQPDAPAEPEQPDPVADGDDVPF